MAFFQSSQQDSLDRIRRGFKWWVNELRELLPSQVQSWLMRQQSRLVIDPDPNELSIRRISGNQIQEVLRLVDVEHVPARVRAELAALGEPVTIRISNDNFLFRPFRLPKAPIRDLRRIIDLELETQSPIRKEDRLFDFRILGYDKASGHLDIDAYVIERQTLDRCLALCQVLGLTPIAIESKENSPTERHACVRLARKLSRRLLLKRWSIPGLTFVATALAIANIAALYLKNLDIEDRLTVAVQKAKIESDAAARLHEEINSAIANLSFLTEKKRASSPALVINEITHLLPDATWLFSLQFHGNDVNIQGFSPKASDLVKAIDQSAYFTDAEFHAPVMQGDGGVERFDLSFKLKETQR